MKENTIVSENWIIDRKFIKHVWFKRIQDEAEIIVYNNV